MSRILVVGNGPAAHRLVQRLRQQGHTDTITVLGAENRPAYNRVLLSSVLEGSIPAASVTLPRLDADVRLGVTATSIDRENQLVHTGSEGSFGYDELILATGARPQLPEVPGLLTADGNLAGAASVLRTLDDCTRISAELVTVLGGGILGVEAAYALAHRGCGVTVVHPRPSLMNRQLDATAAGLLADRMRADGIALELGREAGDYRAGVLQLEDGTELHTEALLVCAGVVPEVALAADAGLNVRRGVVVDDGLATTDERIHAIGDCAEHRCRTPGLIGDAWQQAEALARRLTGSAVCHAGTKSIFRLRVRDLDLVAVPREADAAGAAADTVRLSDAARGRYARLTMQDQQISGAVLVGFPEAVASVSQLYDRGCPAPSDRLGLLLGNAATVPSGPVDPAAEALMCRCNSVTRQALVQAWQDGARDVPALAKATRATTGCGSCTADVDRLCTALASSATATGKDNAA